MPRPPSAVQKAVPGTKRVLSMIMTEVLLALAKREQSVTLLSDRDCVNKEQLLKRYAQLSIRKERLSSPRRTYRF